MIADGNGNEEIYHPLTCVASPQVTREGGEPKILMIRMASLVKFELGAMWWPVWPNLSWVPSDGQFGQI